MDDLVIDIITTILSVVIGGLIAIYTSNLVNRKMLKKEHTLDLLKKVKELLSEWSYDVLEDSVEFTQCSSIDKYKGYHLSLSLRALINIFETNPSILMNFKVEFTEIRNKDIQVQILASKNKESLLVLSEKYGTKDPMIMLEKEDVNQILEEQISKNTEIFEGTWALIAKIDKHIAEKIL
ncbi:MAG: hypothetical protein PHQ32_08135 [Firmicutes bacterium]|nr:hypothetical protein [Bacillota bacterium]